MKKIYDDLGEVRGYEHNGMFLLKNYSFGNHYDWLVSKIDCGHLMNCEIGQYLDNGTIEYVNNFKEGKEKLLNK